MRVFQSATAIEVINSLEQALRQNGLPTTIRVDQGRQFISRARSIRVSKRLNPGPQPPSLTDNAYFESFNTTVRLECLGRHWFLDLDLAGEGLRTAHRVNEVRPHSAIGERTPLSLILDPQHEAEVANRPEIV
jgi:putative transposase